MAYQFLANIQEFNHNFVHVAWSRVPTHSNVLQSLQFVRVTGTNYVDQAFASHWNIP